MKARVPSLRILEPVETLVLAGYRSSRCKYDVRYVRARYFGLELRVYVTNVRGETRVAERERRQ